MFGVFSRGFIHGPECQFDAWKTCFSPLKTLKIVIFVFSPQIHSGPNGNRHTCTLFEVPAHLKVPKKVYKTCQNTLQNAFWRAGMRQSITHVLIHDFHSKTWFLLHFSKFLKTPELQMRIPALLGLQYKTVLRDFFSGNDHINTFRHVWSVF